MTLGELRKLLHDRHLKDDLEVVLEVDDFVAGKLHRSNVTIVMKTVIVNSRTGHVTRLSVRGTVREEDVETVEETPVGPRCVECDARHYLPEA